MPEILSAVEVRILGSLVEKQRTTPEYYPLTLNALTNACNQTSNRDPVVSYDEKTVARGLDSLRQKKLVWMVAAAGSRVPKYEQRITETLELKDPETALLCLLMLRGPQTPGEIRGRSGRLHAFATLEEVQSILDALCARPDPLVKSLPRQPGMREIRWAHLLSGEVEWSPPAVAELRPEAATLQARQEDERMARLEDEVRTLHQTLEELRQQFEQFKKQFD
jgi:uncharacterized protein YceH (UPF0502 family)